MTKVYKVAGITKSPEGFKLGEHKHFGTVIVEAETEEQALQQGKSEGLEEPKIINWYEKPSKPKPLFDNLPSRKELNEERFSELVTKLSEYKGGEKELAFMGALVFSMYTDLPATKQEDYNRVLANQLRALKEENEPKEKIVCTNCGWLEIPGKQDPIEENGKAYCPVCDTVVRKAKGEGI